MFLQKFQKNKARSITEKLKHRKFVSFDVFDTLITRNTSTPEDIFAIIEKSSGISGFCAARLNAQKTAIRKSRAAEISLEEIYNHINLSGIDKAQAIQLEIETEKQYCQANPSIVDIANWCRRSGKTIIIASDMYLPRAAIAQILEQNKIPYDHIFVSSSYQARKSNGKLFAKILNELNVRPKDLFHIGDNIKSDWIIPKLLGIGAQLVRPKKCNRKQARSIGGRIVSAYISNNSHNDRNAYFCVGFESLGPLLLGLSLWIESQLVKEERRNVFFLSRDGHIMHKAFRILFPDFSANYLFASRRSVTVPRLVFANTINDVMELIPYIKRTESMVSFLHKLGIDASDPLVPLCEQKYGYTFARSDLQDGGCLSGLWPEIKSHVLSNAAVELQQSIDFFKRKFDCSHGATLVDIGWYGSMQKSIENILSITNEDVYISGLYLGFLRKGDSNTDLRASGYIFDYRRPTHYNADIIYGFNGLIETFFSAKHGSVRNYALERNEEGCIFEEPEIGNWEAVEQIHSGAIEFIQGIRKYVPDIDNDFREVDAFSGLFRILAHPNAHDIKLFGNLIFFDANAEPLIKWRGWRHYAFHPKHIAQDFALSNWKIGFLHMVVPVPKAPARIYILLSNLLRLFKK